MKTPISSDDVMDLLMGFLQKSLRASILKLSRKDTDGRVNSSINEKEIRTSLKTAAVNNDKFTSEHGLVITDPSDRDWVDFTVEGHETFVPVNIKVTNMDGSADNLSCKLGMFYALTGFRPDFHNTISWENYTERMAKALEKTKGNTNADYYFLVVNKRDPGDVFWTSLKRIEKLTPNGNNLPFQCDWSKNRDRTERDSIEAVNYVLGTFYQSVRLRAQLREQFEANLSGYF